MASVDTPLQPDFFGRAAPARRPRSPHTTVPAGYAAMPGSGPEGETCGSCAHCRYRTNRQGSRRFFKCVLMVAAWTFGRGSDVCVRSPACSKHEPGEPRRTGIVR